MGERGAARKRPARVRQRTGRHLPPSQAHLKWESTQLLGLDGGVCPIEVSGRAAQALSVKMRNLHGLSCPLALTPYVREGSTMHGTVFPGLGRGAHLQKSPWLKSCAAPIFRWGVLQSVQATLVFMRKPCGVLSAETNAWCLVTSKSLSFCMSCRVLVHFCYIAVPSLSHTCESFG